MTTLSIQLTKASRRPLFALLFLLVLLASSAASAQSAPAIAVIPYPAVVTVDSSARYVLGPRATIGLSSPNNAELRALGQVAVDILREELGASAVVSPRRSAARTNSIVLELAPRDTAGGAESYRLDVGRRGVRITAPRHTGLFYGLQTLRGLIVAERARFDTSRAALDSTRLAAVAATRPNRVTLAGMHIEDAPRFTYRGLHIDAGRHFPPAAWVKQFVDVMSRYKYNTLHWHLTEDQGWRIEIKKYPRLTEVGSCRKETQVGRNRNPYVGDGKRYCGFYTQAEIRDVVAYAKAHHVTVIPEIEMPGHSKAVLAAYPELACTAGPFEVRTTWGVDDDIVCPSEATFKFEENVLTEVMALFPSKYIHIGGDEAPKVRWKASDTAQAVMKREGLKSEDELQSYFIRRIERFLSAHGRRLIGWDEILEGGLAPQATVMSWRGITGGIAAARAGHDVVMTPGSHTYFDHTEGDVRFEPLNIGGYLPMDTVYSYEPIPDSLTAEEGKHVLGSQGQLWSEYFPTTQQVEYMAFPRALALSEVVWTPKEFRNWDSFRRRLLPHVLKLDALGVRNRFPAVAGLERDRTVAGDAMTLELRTALPESEIRYTLDGSEPTRQSALYTAPLRLPLTSEGVKVSAKAFLGDRRVSPLRSATFKKQVP
ncbi:MAG: family 20 glycosylhydrolase [Gemmatimonadaceae bacterium]